MLRRLFTFQVHNLHRSLGRAFSRGITPRANAGSKNKRPLAPESSKYSENSHSPSLPQILNTLLSGSKRSSQLRSEDLSCWNFKEYSQAIDKLVAVVPPEKSIKVAKYVVFSSSLPSHLRPRLLASTSHSFLRHGRFTGALAMYKILTSQRFAPPMSLIAAIHRACCTRGDYKPIPIDLTNLALLSLGSLDVRSLSLLLSTLERAHQPEVMEKIVQDYAAQISPTCLTDASVVASMIRGYHAAKELDGCYSWFYRFRSSLSIKNEFISAAPYICLMTASRKLDPTNTKALYRIINMMQEDNLPLITTAYNEILASEVQNRNFERVFSLCSVFQGDPAPVCPDAHTFSLIFDALWKNQTGPKYESTLHPHDLARALIRASESKKIILSVFHINAALRYFVHVGDFQSAIFMVDSALSARISPNALTVRWSLEEMLKRCQRAFDPSANLELESWAKSLLGGLTRDHFAHTTHLLDVVRSTRMNKDSLKITRTAQDALQLVHDILISCRLSASSPPKEKLGEMPVLLLIRDILKACANPDRCV
ncbi:hypothetical protein FRC12_023419 [Ceratobasidium sp. 428]|nr:hypothetical protein FRC09_004803 [Ceratobasidium sp. 395]KAG8780121.1 hypothetical protein FRC12_023419 [Ceratobasidium sp. 428]